MRLEDGLLKLKRLTFITTLEGFQLWQASKTVFLLQSRWLGRSVVCPLNEPFIVKPESHRNFESDLLHYCVRAHTVIEDPMPAASVAYGSVPADIQRCRHRLPVWPLIG
jgi:hypothetical protein